MRSHRGKAIAKTYFRNSPSSTFWEKEGLVDCQRLLFKIWIHKTICKSNGQNNKLMISLNDRI